MKETIIDKTVYKKGREEGHEEGASHALSGPTGGEGCEHGGGMSDMWVWSSRHGAFLYRGSGVMNGSASMAAKRGVSMSVPVQWLEVNMVVGNG